MNSMIERFPIFAFISGTFFLFSSCSKDKQVVDSYSQYIEKAIKCDSKQQNDSAFFYYNKAKLVCKTDETERKIYALSLMSTIQQRENDFVGSEETVTEALKLDPNTSYLPNLYNQLGIVYIELLDTKNAIKYYDKAAQSTTDALYKIILVNNIAVTYIADCQFQKATRLLEPLLQNPLLNQNPLEKARVLNNLGRAYFKKDNSLGISELEKSLQIRIKEKADFDLISSYFALYEFYAKKDSKRSQYYANLSYQKATASNSINDRLTALKYLIEISDNAAAKKYALKQIQLSDSIGIVRQKAKNQFAKIKYDTRFAIEESEKQKKQKTLALVTLGLLLVFGIAIFWYIRRKNRQKLKAISYETETRISKQLHDELANDVYYLMTYANTQDLQNPQKKEILLDNLDKIYAQTRNISKSNSEIETGLHFEEYLNDMLSSFSSSKINVIVNRSTTIDWLAANKQTKITIYRILQELMVNMKKHSQATIVVIGFENHKTNLEVSYSDNGIGCPEKLKFKKGLQNAENRIDAIKGTIIFETETNKGFKAKMNFPK